IENIKLNNLNNVVALNIAAWKEEGILKLFIGDMHGHHSVKRNFGLGYVEVRAKALDEVIDQLKVKKVNLIKIDVEGAELEVLEGLARTLEKYRPTVIVEVLGDPRKVEEFANSKGYKMKRINPTNYILKPSML
ncbi:MAG: FkbM family methyltransferase, partial [Candidatus Korarchaeota archaeon]